MGGSLLFFESGDTYTVVVLGLSALPGGVLVLGVSERVGESDLRWGGGVSWREGGGVCRLTGSSRRSSGSSLKLYVAMTAPSSISFFLEKKAEKSTFRTCAN